MVSKEVNVDMALLPSCGLGSRMGELTKNNPKCLIEVNGERLIERQIRQLKSAGIDNIVVMTGYLHEQLEYLKDKYSVKLVYNEEYATKNTIATLHKALDEIRDRNVYITCTDLYYPNNVFHSTEFESFAAGSFKHDCTDEWVCDLDDNDRILRVLLGEYDDYYYTGLCFLKKEMVNELSDLVEEYYEKEGNGQMYWEEVMLYNLDRLPELHYHKCEAGVIREFDTPDDLKDFIQEQEAIKDFSRINNIDDPGRIKAQAMVLGMNNLTYRMDYEGKRYFFRKPGNMTEVFHNRVVEKEVYEILGNYDIADEVLYFDSETGIKIAKYYEMARNMNPGNINELKDTMAAYRRLHNIKGSINNSCEIQDVFNDYIRKFEKLNINTGLSRFEEVMSICIAKAKSFSKLDRPRCICHGDCSAANVIYTEDGIRLIDFEFTGMADPLSDIAVFGIAEKFGVEETLRLYDYYKDAAGYFEDEDLFKDDSFNRKLIAEYMVVTCMSSVLWGIISKHNRQYDLDDYIKCTYDLLNRIIREVEINADKEEN